MAQYNLFNPDDVRVGLLIFFEYEASMAQHNLYLFNPNNFRVGSLAYDGAITLSIKVS